MLHTPMVEHATPLAQELLADRYRFLSKLIYGTGSLHRHTGDGQIRLLPGAVFSHACAAESGYVEDAAPGGFVVQGVHRKKDALRGGEHESDAGAARALHWTR